MRAHRPHHVTRAHRLVALLALTLACLLAGPAAVASAQDPVAATTQAVAGVAATAEQQVPAAAAVDNVVGRTDEAVRGPVERIPAQVGAQLGTTGAESPQAAPAAQPAAPAAPPATARTAPAAATPEPAGTPKAIAARKPDRGTPRAGAAGRREARRAADAPVPTPRELNAAAARQHAGAHTASASAATRDGELPRPDAPSGDHGVGATGAIVSGTGAAFAAVAVLAGILLLLRPARRGTPLRLPSPAWSSAVLTLSIERPG